MHIVASLAALAAPPQLFGPSPLQAGKDGSEPMELTAAVAAADDVEEERLLDEACEAGTSDLHENMNEGSKLLKE